MCNVQSVTYVVMATGLSLFDNATSSQMLLKGSLRLVCVERPVCCSLPAEMAAVLHPRPQRKKGGLCHRESADLFPTVPQTQAQFPHLNRAHLCVPGSAHHLWRWRCQISKRNWRPHLRLQYLHGGQVRLCANVSLCRFHDRNVFAHYF